jgi:chromosome segregation ATPase
MKTKHSDLVEKLTVRVNAEVVSAIQKSGQSAPDWLRQAARNQIDGERQAETPTGQLEKQVAALQQRIDDLKKDGIDTRKEIARLQQSETIVQAALLDLRKNHVELRRSLEQMNAGFGHAFNALGQSLLVALSQQLRELVKAQEEPPKRPLPPILPRTRL